MMDSYYECFFKGDEDFQSADCVRDCYAPAIEEDREPKIVHTYCQNPLLMGTEIQKPLKDMQEKKLTSEYVQPQCQVSDKADSRATRKKKSGFWPFSKLGRLFSRDREKKDKRRFSAPPVMDVSTSLDKQNTHEKPLYARTESPGASSSLKKQENYGNKMLEMIRLQHIDGHWALTQAVTALLGVKDDVIKSFKMEKEADVITTLAVIVWLRSKFGDKHDEWEMIEQKALTWLCSKTGQEKSLEDLLEKIKRHLWPRGL